MQLSVRYGSQQLDFETKYSSRKTLAISVYPDFRIEVKAPESAKPEQIQERVKKKARWIIRQIDYFESFLPRTPERKFISGETHKYLGKQYQLKVIDDNYESVKLQAGFLIVRGSNLGYCRVRQLLASWYFHHAKKKIDERYDVIRPTFMKYGLEANGIRYKRMMTRWGSCDVKFGKIIINPEIIKAPIRCIDYVIMHEFCHLKHNNHGAKFYQMLNILMPDWGKWKQRLEESMV